MAGSVDFTSEGMAPEQAQRITRLGGRDVLGMDSDPDANPFCLFFCVETPGKCSSGFCMLLGEQSVDHVACDLVVLPHWFVCYLVRANRFFGRNQENYVPDRT